MITDKMLETPLQDVRKFCVKCDSLKFVIQKRNEGKLEKNDIARLRDECARCRLCDGGIYKADAIMGAISAFPSRKLTGKGKACVIPVGVQEKVIEYRKNGLSQQKIADLIQETSGYKITRRQVQKIIKKLNK